MRHRRHKTMTRLGAAAGAALLISGCAHNDVLVFGTSTTIGLNVQTASTQGAAPSIVLGYEREEAVWMPLVLNGRDSKLDLCAADEAGDCEENEVPVEEAMYRSTIITGEGARRREQQDTYSVFASLGARFNGEASTNNGVEAGGGLAQFFATGNAAVNISQNEALMTALKLESEGGARAQADAVESAALSAEQRAIADRLGQTRRSNLEKIQRCVAGAVTWRALITESGLSADDQTYLLEGVGATTDVTGEFIADRLQGETAYLRALASEADKKCPGAQS